MVVNRPFTVSSASKRKPNFIVSLPEQGSNIRVPESYVRKLQKPKKRWISRWESMMMPSFEALQSRTSPDGQMDNTREITKLCESGSGRKKRIKRNGVAESNISSTRIYDSGSPRPSMNLPISESFVEEVADFSHLHLLADTAIQDDMKRRKKGFRSKRIKQGTEQGTVVETQIFLTERSESRVPRNTKVPMRESFEEEANKNALHQLADTVIHMDNDTKRTSARKRGRRMNQDSVAGTDVHGSYDLECRRGNMRIKEHLMEPNSIPVHLELEKHNDANRPPVKHQFLGITFYKRIGRWTAHIWAEKKQHYLGSYSSATEAARAYDKASLRHFGKAAKLNFQRCDYLREIDKMDGITTERYRDILKTSSQKSEPVIMMDGVSRCPEGWFEVKFREQTPPRIWQFLGRFDNLEDAKRCYQTELSGEI